jgi:hypothetical protein
MLPDFFQSDHFLALLAALLIFLIALFLVVKRWIGFWIALLLLLFSLAAGFLINHQNSIENYLETSQSVDEVGEKEDSFRKQMVQAVADLKIELGIEKENLKKVVHQVQEIVDSIDVQKQKLQHFIEETRERFKAESSSKSSSSDSATESSPDN